MNLSLYYVIVVNYYSKFEDDVPKNSKNDSERSQVNILVIICIIIM